LASGGPVFGDVLIKGHQGRPDAVAPHNEFLNYDTIHVGWVFEKVYSRRDSGRVLLVAIVVLTSAKKYAIGA
jgi:hypothetical protein